MATGFKRWLGRGVCAVLAAGVSLGAAGRADGLTINQYSAATHNRFLSGYPNNPVPNPNFFASAWDWSGVGWDSQNSNRSVALVSPQHFVAANHFLPPVGRVLNFLGQDGLVHQYTVAGYSNTNYLGQTSDLALGWLTEAIKPADKVTWYPVVEADGEDWFTGKEVITYGTTTRAGRNIIDRVTSTATGANTTRVFTYTYDRTYGLGADEAGAEAGDSGSPSFMIHDGRMTLLGTHFAVNGTTPLRYKTFDSFIPHYLNQLDAAMASTPYSIERVPWLAPIFGDVDGNRVLDDRDIDSLYSMIRQGTFKAAADLNGDGKLSVQDVDRLVVDVLESLYGDLDMDGLVAVGDLVELASHFGMETTSWRMGDLNGDGVVSIGDMILFGANYGQMGAWGALRSPASISSLVIPLPGTWAGGAILLGLAALRGRRGADRG